ncbi:helix-turn-helix domain-containing protein [Arthrobacter zhaoguopingii]|uniref:helix-turn-helix domain-containing protein n=1 Tax=Arthrobacter zhaoguopingii TaxID=2681491 RepID=UPI001359797E|nr:XRE family transcriptional regulator [Arthrobacter zhaoguopingii]
MTMDFHDVIDALGSRLRQQRHSSGLTLAAVSELTGIPVSTLSRVESGKRRPGLELLLPLARAYNVPLEDLIGAPTSGDPRLHPRPFQYHGMVVIPLTRNPGGLQVFKQILPAALTDNMTPEPKSHEGYHWLYLLSGRLRMILGEKDFILSAGEVAEFDTHLPHWYGNADEHAVEFLSILGAQGQRIHLKAAMRK